ncbi:hypothetical protein B0H21DRAFT_885462 [Amylocystis lapponica]|nr:hypothetical protein B0H21DRAFT_885462 [Amylocystis lapponica]
MAAILSKAPCGVLAVPVGYYPTHPTSGSPSAQASTAVPQQDGQQRLAGTKRKADGSEQVQADGSTEPSKKRARHELAAGYTSEWPYDSVFGVLFAQRAQQRDDPLRRAARSLSGWDAVVLRLQRVHSEIQVLSDSLSEVHGHPNLHRRPSDSTGDKVQPGGGLILDVFTGSVAPRGDTTQIQDEHENGQVDVPEDIVFERPHWKKSQALWKVACKWRVGVVLEAYGQQAICETVRKEAAKYHRVRARTVEPCGHESDVESTVDWSGLGFYGEGEGQGQGDHTSPSALSQDESGALEPEEDAVVDDEHGESEPESEDTQHLELPHSRSPTPDSEYSRSRSPTPDSDHDSDPDSLPNLRLIRLSRLPVESLEDPYPEPQWFGTPGWLPNRRYVRGSLLDADTPDYRARPSRLPPTTMWPVRTGMCLYANSRQRRVCSEFPFAEGHTVNIALRVAESLASFLQGMFCLAASVALEALLWH